MKSKYLIVATLGVVILVFIVWLLMPVARRTHGHYGIRDTTRLRALAQGMAAYAGNQGDTYPDGYGILIYEGYITPSELLTSHDPRDWDRLDELNEYEWNYDDEELIPEMNGVAAEYSSFVVLAWNEPQTFNPEEVLAYERLSNHHDTILIAYADIRVEEVPRAKAIKILQAAGHEPVWVD